MKPEVLLVMNACHPECESILRGIANYQTEHQSWQVFVDNAGRTECDPDWILTHPWQGVISRTTTQSLVDVCALKQLPLVDMNDCEIFLGVPKIRPDNRAIGHMAAEDLYERGYRNMYFCGYPGELWSRERRDGFFEALRLLGCEASEFSLPHGCTLAPAENAAVIQRMEQWLKTLVRPAGIMAAHDLRASQLLSAAEKAGVIVPDEVAIMGVNNDQVICELSSPALSSVATGTLNAGYLAASELAVRMAGGRGTHGEILVEPLKVCTRRSTDTLAINDPAIARALSLIRAKACEGISVGEVTRMASISRCRLECGFRRYLGRSPQAEIRRLQLARIKQLLLETDLPLKRIAEMTGYEHTEYMNVSFKRAVGESPGRFRRSMRNLFDAAGPVLVGV